MEENAIQTLTKPLKYSKASVILSLCSLTVILTVLYWRITSSLVGFQSSLAVDMFYALFIVPLQIFFPLAGIITGFVAIFGNDIKKLSMVSVVINLGILIYAFYAASIF